MTTEEAIEHISSWAECKYKPTHDAACLAIAALRAQAESERNEPLTLGELREMCQRCEGVYVAYLDGTPVFREQTYCAAVLDFSTAFGTTEPRIHAIDGDRLTLWGDEYGKTWLAYRRKPKEGTPWTRRREPIRPASSPESRRTRGPIHEDSKC